MSVCQEQNIEPKVAFEHLLQEFTKQYQQKQDDDLRAKKMAYAGILPHLANPSLMALEEQMLEMAIKEKYSIN